MPSAFQGVGARLQALLAATSKQQTGADPEREPLPVAEGPASRHRQDVLRAGAA